MLQRLSTVSALALACAVVVSPATAEAFCGFYVSGGDAKLYNNATLVVLMRDGTRTVLSMQNNYQGPPENFAMVVPVPVVLQKDDVKTLPREIFDRVDRLAAPRLVEYWEQDPCAPDVLMLPGAPVKKMASTGKGGGGGAPADYGVTIEAQFTVGEYEVVILSAKDSNGLDGWLRNNKYTIPEGAEPVLRPYVQQGMKFFVAKVDVSKVSFGKDGQAMLSPLRFHYDSESFNLPVRLGLLNSSGVQDLLVHVLASERYEVANYPNAFVPTNLEVKESARAEFGKFYVALLDAVMRQQPGAVVTEYAWQANNCDPCPETPLQLEELVTLGADVLPSYAGRVKSADGSASWQVPGEFVLTRLHARYGKEALGEDLVFRAAKAIVGGREVGEAGKLEKGAQPGGTNTFQGRYIIRHPWTGPVTCKEPIRGRWGGPWPDWKGGGGAKPQAAQGLAFAERGANLGMYVAQDMPELQVVAADDVPMTKQEETKVEAKTEAKVEAKSESKTAETVTNSGAGCGCAAGETDATGGLAGLLGLVWLGRRRRR
ncbi:DUF2330 domain-containing protein [Nannocystis sp. SCPEA4]|uniref:DUF2330 domain-containing protein n=1 Tax=Nannocystis sp. SCPEA4 TaxID=2996787 RepID=UPI00226E8BE2|nr:DUF2330 domain-containing protein [Nannocystis sp. SCPEA4]MCY1055694.1 DUF2330 domain-containing protein [Nannocystis sp. SCPEA4]